MNPCFCANPCPNGSQPYLKYKCFTDDSDFPEFISSKAFEFDGVFSGDCLWKPIENEDDYSLQNLVKQEIFDPDFDHAYEWSMTLVKGPASNLGHRTSTIPSYFAHGFVGCRRR